jgi:hypothetical protein
MASSTLIQTQEEFLFDMYGEFKDIEDAAALQVLRSSIEANYSQYNITDELWAHLEREVCILHTY